MGLLKKYNEQAWKLAYYPQNDPVQGLSTIDKSLTTSALEDSFDKTNLDLENAAPFGGPNNFPSYNHTQKWLPQDGKGFADSTEGQIRGDGKLQTTFDKTDLDLTNPSPLGGPINIPYTTKIGNKVESKTTTQPYTPKNTYIDSLQSPELIARAKDPFK
jgi:hypothetical protein